MKTSWESALIVSLTVIATLGAHAADTDAKNILVVGWDGVQRDHLKEMLGRDELPAFKALAAEGKMVDIDVTTSVTDTKAGWTQIFTGYAPDKSGVYSNSRYRAVPEDLWVFDRAEKHSGAEGIDTVAVIGKKGHVDNDPSQLIPYEKWQRRQDRIRKMDKKRPGKMGLDGGTIVEKDGKKFVEVPAKPWNLVSQHMDLFVNGLVKNKAVGERAMQELENRKDHRFLFFVHFAEPDHAGHHSGENSQQYTEAIKDSDAWTGRLIEKLKGLGLYEKTLVYIVSDHGFNEDSNGHRYAPYVELATNDTKVNRNGDRMDIAPTVLKRLGMDPASFSPKIDGIALDEPAPERKAPPTPPTGYEEMRATGKKPPEKSGEK